MNTTLSKISRLGLANACLNSERLCREDETVINQAKRRDRPNMKLNDWDKEGYHKNRKIQQLAQCSDQIDRVDSHLLSQEIFNEKYQKKKIPLIIKGCTEYWRAEQFWNFAYFLQNYEKFKFKVGQDDDGQKIKIPLKTFMEYLVHNTDDSPLYLFQNTNVVPEQIRPILKNYRVPSFFQEDVFGLLGDEVRPAFRWLLIGPERSGSTVHIDPMMTCAWNASLVGRKRWVIFDAGTPKSIVKGKQFRDKNEPDQAIYYFLKVLPKIRAKYSAQSLGLRQFIQYPGETVFVPGGAWHAVINLDDTIAVTQNVMNSYNFEEVWNALKVQNRMLAATLQQKIKANKQILYDRILKLNKNEEQSVSFSEKEDGLVKYEIKSRNEESEKDQFLQIQERIEKKLMKKCGSLGYLNENKSKERSFSEGKRITVEISEP